MKKRWFTLCLAPAFYLLIVLESQLLFWIVQIFWPDQVNWSNQRADLLQLAILTAIIASCLGAAWLVLLRPNRPTTAVIIFGIVLSIVIALV